MTTQSNTSTAVSKSPNVINQNSKTQKPKQSKSTVVLVNELLMAKHKLTNRLIQTQKYKTEIISRLAPYKDTLTVQQFESIRLYKEVIGTIDNIVFSINNHRINDLDTLMRKVIERYVYLHVTVSNQKQAQSLHLKAGIALCKRRNYIDVNGKLNEELDLPKNLMRLKKLDAKYRSGFSDEANPDKWFNLDGNTTCMEKLIQSYGINQRYNTLYMILSHDVHAVKVTTTLKQLMSVEPFETSNEEPEHYILEALMDILNETDRLINKVKMDVLNEKNKG